MIHAKWKTNMEHKTDKWFINEVPFPLREFSGYSCAWECMSLLESGFVSFF